MQMDSAGRVKNKRTCYRYGTRFAYSGIREGGRVLYASGSRWICGRLVLKNYMRNGCLLIGEKLSLIHIFRFNVSNGEVRGMSLFALLYPSKTLSDMYLPIESLNNHESLEVCLLYTSSQHLCSAVQERKQR